jgi:predicted RNase H-like nuclease (RuvC/YqgF family)
MSEKLTSAEKKLIRELVIHEHHLQRFVSELDSEIAELKTKVELLLNVIYKLARHLNNTDDLSLTSWGVTGVELLTEVRSIDPVRYDSEVRRKLQG